MRPTPTAWEAVRVHYDGYPKGLGAALIAAIATSSAEDVLEHAFSTTGWTSWPGRPHHPRDPEDALVTPDTIWEESFTYWFDLEAGTLEIRESFDRTIEPQHRFDLEALRGNELGEAEPVEPVAPFQSFERQCRPEREQALRALLDALGVDGPLGVATAIAPWNRHLHLGDRAVDLAHGGFRGAVFFTPDGELPMPDLDAFRAAHPGVLEAAHAGIRLPEEPTHSVWMALFDGLFEEGVPLDDAPPYPRVVPPPLPRTEDLLAMAGSRDRLEQTLGLLATNHLPGAAIEAVFDPDLLIVRYYTVVRTVTDPDRQLSLEAARELDPDCQPGDDLGVQLSPTIVNAVLREAPDVLANGRDGWLGRLRSLFGWT